MRLGQTSFIHFISKSVASAIGFVATIYFAQLLGADTLGIYFLILGLVSWIELGGRMGVSSAITKRVSEGHEQGQYVVAGFLIIVGLSLSLSAAVFLFQNQINDYIGDDVAELVILLTISTLLFSFSMAVLKGSHLVHIFALLSSAKIGLRSVLQVIAVFMGFGLTGLLVGYALGWLITSTISLAFISIKWKRPTVRHFRRLISYAQYAWLGTVESRSFKWVDIVLLGFFVQSGLIGIYSVAWTIASFLNIFGTSISESFFPEISKRSSEGRIQNVAGLVEDTLAYAGLFLIPGLVGGFVLGDRVLAFYGDEFTEGTAVLSILIAACLFYGYQKQLLNALNAIDRPQIAFRVNAVFILLNITLNLLLIYLYGWIGAAVATAFVAVLGASLAYYSLSLYISFNVPTTEIVKQTISAGIMGGVVLLTELLLESTIVSNNNVIATLLLVALGSMIYFTLLFALSTRFRVVIVNNLPSNMLNFSN